MKGARREVNQGQACYPEGFLEKPTERCALPVRRKRYW